jgi:secretion/DNA translocation related CpaE-like protein
MKYALLVTRDEILSAQFHKMCAVTQSQLVVRDRVTSEDLIGAYRVFIDQSLAPESFIHNQVVILAPDGTSAQTWQLALQLDAEHVEVLPSQTDWLIEHLVPPADTRAHVVSVTPVVGGAGASTMACALAAQYSAQGMKVCLIDADLGAGGLDVVMGCEQAEGMRWADFAGLEGTVSGTELYDSVIISGGIHLVAPKRGQFDIELNQIIALIETVATACDVVLIDTPRLADRITRPLNEVSDDVLLVIPTTVQASSLVTSHKEALSQTRCGLVARQVPGSGLTALGIAQAVDIPLRASVPTDTRIVEQVEQGLGLTHVTLGAFSRAIKQLSSEIESHDDKRIAV